MLIAAHAVAVLQASDFATVAHHFRGLRVENDIDVFQAADFILQNLVGLHFRRELQQSNMFNNASQIDCRFHTGVTAADNRHALAFKQRAVAVRAVGHALGTILILTRHVHVTPFRASGNDNATRFQHRAGSGLNLMQAAFNRRRDQSGGALRIDHINIVFADVRF